MGLVFAWWRALPGYGRRHNWPPGSLGLGASLDAVGDRHFYADQARIHGPVFKMSQFGRPVLCVLGLARGRDVLLNNADFLAAATLSYNRFVPKGSLRYMTNEEHHRESPLFRTALADVDLAGHEEVVRRTCRDVLSRLSAASVLANDGAAPRDYLAEWVFLAFAGIFFGLDPEDPRLPTLDRARQSLKIERAGGRRWGTEMEASFVELTDLLRDQARQLSPSEPASALSGVLEADPNLLENEARTRNLILIFRLATGDLTALLDWVTTKLSQHPEWQARVRGEEGVSGGPHGTQPNDVASRVVLETLRMEQSEYLYRTVVRPIEVEGYDIPPGWLVRICVQESHRDPEIFKDPDLFDPERFANRRMTRREYSPFGADHRACMGVSMVHFMGRVFVEELCGGYELLVTRDAPMEKGTRHRDHWRPSPDRRVVLNPLA